MSIFLLKKTWPLGNQTSKRKVIQKFLNPIEKKGQKKLSHFAERLEFHFFWLKHAESS